MGEQQSVSTEAIAPDPKTSVTAPVMRQSWRHVTFIHWRCDPTIVRRLVPAELELDLFSGECWIGLVPFLITDLTTPRGPAVPWLSEFPETNVRTYVIDRHGRRGVWFFSLDAARWLAVVAARLGFGLPYYWARMRVCSDGKKVQYSSVRVSKRSAMSQIAVEIGTPIEGRSLLELFVTARFRLYARRRNRLMMAEISHQPWPLQRATIVELRQTLAEAAGLPGPESSAMVHFARGVDVMVGLPVEVGSGFR